MGAALLAEALLVAQRACTQPAQKNLGPYGLPPDPGRAPNTTYTTPP